MSNIIHRNVCIRVALALLTAGAGLLYGTSRAANDAPVQVVVEPASPIARHADTALSGTLHLTNAGAVAARIRLEARPMMLKGGQFLAVLSFPTQGNKDFVAEVQVPAANASNPGAVDVAFTVKDMGVAGSYEGAIDVISLADESRRTRVAVVVARQAASFDPAITGPNVVNGVLTVKPASAKDGRFWFTVENPKGNSDITVSVSSPASLSGRDGPVAVRFSPASFPLAAGATRPVEVILGSASGCASGSAPATPVSGKIVVGDANEPGQQKQIDLIVQPAFTPFSQTLLLVLLVIIGTATSILVGTIVPTLMARQTAWNRLKTLSGTIEVAADRGSPVQLALETQWHRIDFLAHDIWWFSTRAAELLTNIDKQMDDLEKRIDIVARASQLRCQVRMGDTVPVSVVPGIERALDDVVRSAAGGNVASAEQALQKVQSNIDDTGLAQVVQTSLMKRVAALPASNPAPAGASAVMCDRLVALMTKAPQQGQQLDFDDLLHLDRECFAAHLYFVRYRDGVLRLHAGDIGFIGLEPDLIVALTDGPLGLWRANALVQSMELGVLQSDIDTALTDKRAQIEAKPSRLIVNELVEFALAFDDVRLAESPLARSVVVQWTFGDDTSPARGLRCIHFFGPKIFKGSKWRVPSINVDIVARVNAQEFKLTIPLQRERALDAVITRGEVFSTACVFFGAVALTLMSHQADIHPFGAISDFANPFLWGFGLDRMKSLVAAKG